MFLFKRLPFASIYRQRIYKFVGDVRDVLVPHTFSHHFLMMDTTLTCFFWINCWESPESPRRPPRPDGHRRLLRWLHGAPRRSERGGRDPRNVGGAAQPEQRWVFSWMGNKDGGCWKATGKEDMTKKWSILKLYMFDVSLMGWEWWWW